MSVQPLDEYEPAIRNDSDLLCDEHFPTRTEINLIKPSTRRTCYVTSSDLPVALVFEYDDVTDVSHLLRDLIEDQVVLPVPDDETGKGMVINFGRLPYLALLDEPLSSDQAKINLTPLLDEYLDDAANEDAEGDAV